MAARHTRSRSTAVVAKSRSGTMKSETPALSDAELDKVTGGKQSSMAMLTRMIQAKNDMQKSIISNFRV
jgi:hypothetical protein